MADIRWLCQLNHPGATQDQIGTPILENESLTVGETFLLSCQGPESVQFDAKAGSLELPKEQQYALRVLKNLGMDGHKANFVATSYLVNPNGHQFQNIFLSDGKVRIALDGIGFKVKSVITKENNPKNEPYPPWGPFGFAYPNWIWMGLSFVIILIASVLIEKLMQKLKRKKFFKILASQPPTLSAYHQFSKELRQLSRESLRPQNFGNENAKKFIDELKTSFRWYLSRKLQFSCFDQSSQSLMKELKEKNRPLYSKVQHSLSLALIEIERWQQRPDKIKIEDASQLIDMVRNSAEELGRFSEDKSELKKSKARLVAEV